MTTNTAIEKTGKIWTWSTFIRDHTRFVTILPGYLGAFISFSPFSSSSSSSSVLPPNKIEHILVTVNSSTNTCPYCTGLHGQLARMAGVTKMEAGSSRSDPALEYATTFGLESGRGPDVDASYEKLCKAIGPERSRSVQCLCWAALWGKTTGNTINNARDKILGMTKSWSQITTLDLFVLAYYGPLFVVIAIMNACLTFMPDDIPPLASKIIGMTLWLPLTLNILPFGIVSIVLCGGKVI